MSRASPTRKDGCLFKTNFVCFSTCRRFPRFPQINFAEYYFVAKKCEIEGDHKKGALLFAKCLKGGTPGGNRKEQGDGIARLMSRASPTRKDGCLFKTNFVCFSTCRRFPRFPQNEFCGVRLVAKGYSNDETVKKALCGSKVPKRWYSRRESNPQRPLRSLGKAIKIAEKGVFLTI